MPYGLFAYDPHCVAIALIACVSYALGCGEVRAQGVIQALVDDVHNGTGGGSGSGSGSAGGNSSSADTANGRAASDSSDGSDGMPFELIIAAGYGTFYIATSPFWLPISALKDSGDPAYFPRFPYDHRDGYLSIGPSAAAGRPWSGRFSVDYLEPFTEVNGVGGRLWVEHNFAFRAGCPGQPFRRATGRRRVQHALDRRLQPRLPLCPIRVGRVPHGPRLQLARSPSQRGPRRRFRLQLHLRRRFLPGQTVGPLCGPGRRDARPHRAGPFPHHRRDHAPQPGMLHRLRVSRRGRTHFNLLVAGVRLWF